MNIACRVKSIEEAVKMLREKGYERLTIEILGNSAIIKCETREEFERKEDDDNEFYSI